MILLVTLAVSAVVLLGYEWWDVATHHPTITDEVRGAYRYYPPLGFLVGLGTGLLLAHFFWQ